MQVFDSVDLGSEGVSIEYTTRCMAVLKTRITSPGSLDFPENFALYTKFIKK